MFLTLNEYLLGARRLLTKYGYPCHLKDEDAVAYVAHCMMKADQTWDGTKSSRDTWRFNQARWAIGKLRAKKRKERKHVSLHAPIRGCGNNGTGKATFLHDVLEAQDNTYVYREAAEVMKQAKECLDERQYACVESYYLKSMTLQQIGDQLGCTREYVRQILKKAMNRLRNECGAEADSFAS